MQALEEYRVGNLSHTLSTVRGAQERVSAQMMQTTGDQRLSGHRVLLSAQTGPLVKDSEWVVVGRTSGKEGKDVV